MDSLLFRKLNISTITINVESNIFFNLAHVIEFFFTLDGKGDDVLEQTKELLLSQRELTHTEYKKQVFPKGTISYICYKTKWGGVRRKKKKTTKKRNDFVNQVTLDVFIEPTRKINVMLFRNGRIKLAGCKTANDAVVSVLRLYELLSKTPDCVVMGSEPTAFIFRNEMINISFSFPFTINKPKVNKLFNKIPNCLSFYEQTGQQYVNVKMFGDQKHKKAIQLVLPRDDSDVPKISVVDIPINNQMKTCFMLFEKRVIMSGVDYKTMEGHFETFRNIFKSNIDEISID